MADDLVERLWANDAASALTNQAARRIEELQKALAFYADERRYRGPNQWLPDGAVPDEYQPAILGYLLDVTRDYGEIARKALNQRAIAVGKSIFPTFDINVPMPKDTAVPGSYNKPTGPSSPAAPASKPIKGGGKIAPSAITPVITCSREKQLLRALNLALCMLLPHEVPDSRGVSDEYVALATVEAGIDNDASWHVIEAALEAARKVAEAKEAFYET